MSEASRRRLVFVAVPDACTFPTLSGIVSMKLYCFPC